MTTAVLASAHTVSPLRAVADTVRRAGADAPVYAGIAILLALAIPPTLAALALDTRTVEGASVWVKPLKFEVALAIYAATLAFFAGYVPERVRAARWHRAFVALVGVSFAYEIVWIAGAAAAGVPSHFNLVSPLMAQAYQLAGIGAVTLTLASLVTGLAIAANRDTGLDPAVKLAIVAGLVLTFAATVPVAGYLSGQPGHFVGGAPGAPAGTWPLFGWATDRGDLRVAHFLATHALHVLPLVGLAAVAVGGEAHRRRLVLLATALYAGLIAYAFFEARAGRPFLSTLIG